MKQSARSSLNGDVSSVEEGVTFRYLNDTKDYDSFTSYVNETLKITLGTYTLDMNPLIGFIANVNVSMG